MASEQGAVPTQETGDFNFKLYRYTPSLPGAIIFTVIFFLLGFGHLWRLLRAKATYFIPFLVGISFETIGYAGRIWSHYDKEALGGFIIQAILILVAPALFAASIYMILGRLIRSIRAEHLSFIPIKWLTKIFVTGDVLSFSLQAAGGGLQSAGTLEAYENGEKIIIAGLFLQIAIFGFFVVTSVLFHFRVIKAPTEASMSGPVMWKRHIIVLYTTSGLILVRSIFRVVEYLQGNDGYLISHEVFLFVFDAVLMFAVVVIFLIWFVDDIERKITPKTTQPSVMDSSDGTAEEMQSAGRA